MGMPEPRDSSCHVRDRANQAEFRAHTKRQRTEACRAMTCKGVGRGNENKEELGTGRVVAIRCIQGAASRRINCCGGALCRDNRKEAFGFDTAPLL